MEFNQNNKNYKTFIKYTQNKYNNGKHQIEKLLEKNHLVIDTRQSDLRLYQDCVPTLRTGRHGIMYVRENNFRKLSGFEALLLQGFPVKVAKKAKGKISDVHLLSQAGNAMTVNTIQSVGKSLLSYINK